MNRNISKIAAILSLSVTFTMIGQPAFAKTTFTPLKQGMNNARVLEVEKMLDALHFDHKLKVDKLYTVDTVYNVKQFQKKYKLKQTGIVNKATYDKLNKVYKAQKTKPAPKPETPSKPAEPAVTLKLGSTGERVKDLQAMLANLGYKVAATGTYDDSTRFAVMLFQSRNKQTLTGEADAKTYQAIEEQYKNNKNNPKPTPTPTPTPTPPVTPTQPEKPQNPGTGTTVPLPADLTADEKEMVQLVNQERTSRGLAPYQVDMQLVKVARVKAQEMVTKGYFSHTSPTYGSPFQMMDTFGINYMAAAENIAQNPSVSGAHQMFMNSSGHKTNILSPTYDYVGIAVVNGGPYGKTFVQMFLKK
ncbi:peptidoglycan-binding protein [Brevibacillus parabrevis]|uniref:peptidoglycan-binding protein n=1 Tax=Brevibacillus parabrevis TaxID=54914 RepID=UPI002E1E396C|nr:peptidoglycan-binding protein [Brevibacillus parabrevis]